MAKKSSAAVLSDAPQIDIGIKTKDREKIAHIRAPVVVGILEGE